MRSSFFEFNVATSAVFLAKSALTVTANNIANAETPGYSRQYAELRATSPIALFTGKGMIGTGGEVYGIGQFRNFYLDTKYWAESSVLGEYGVKRIQMDIIQRKLNDLSSTGTTSCFDDFFASIQNLTTSAKDQTYRTNVIKAAETLTGFINTQTESLKKQQIDINEEVKIVVSRINSLGQQIRSLNEQIFKFEGDGSSANDLRDARALLVDELSKYVNVEVKETEMNKDYAAGFYPDPDDRSQSQKRFSVTINGYDFVNHFSAQTLTVAARTGQTNPMDVPGLYDVYFGGEGGTKFNIYDPDLTGELKGLIDVRDGNNMYYFQGNNLSNTVGNILEMTANEGMRLDLQEGSSGKITVTDASGNKVELSYKNLTMDYTTSPPKYKFDIDTTKTPMPTAALAGATATVGVTSVYKGIPHYLDKLNELVRTFSRAINEGIDKNGNKIPGVTGHIYGYTASTSDGEDVIPGVNLKTLFFSYNQNVNTGAITDYNKMTCENFQINSQLLKDSSLVATSSTAAGGVDQYAVIEGFLTIEECSSLFREGKISDYIGGISSEIGIDVKQATNFEKNYTDVQTTIQNQRLSVSGVNLSEEATLAMRYQQLFQAASKLINIINDIYNTTINKMGV